MQREQGGYYMMTIRVITIEEMVYLKWVSQRKLIHVHVVLPMKSKHMQRVRLLIIPNLPNFRIENYENKNKNKKERVDSANANEKEIKRKEE